MTDKQTKYTWQKQKFADDCEAIDCPPYDDYADFKRDPTGYYVLIKTELKDQCIEVGICNKAHEIIKVFRGSRSQDLYNTIFKSEKDNNAEWFKEKTHIAYLGKELKKAELALAEGRSDYIQE